MGAYKVFEIRSMIKHFVSFFLYVFASLDCTFFFSRIKVTFFFLEKNSFYINHFYNPYIDNCIILIIFILIQIMKIFVMIPMLIIL
jgi:hypothetical protein